MRIGLAVVLLVAASLGGCKQGRGEPCVETAECGTALKCADWRCVTGPDSDCRASVDCKQGGQCTARDGKCVGTSDADCRASRWCLVHGGCTVRDGKCVGTSDADCRASSECAGSGECTARDGKCFKGL